MARAGINKALVQRARDALLARGLTPSIEAVRAELGHTGSKTTILRYLRELDVAEPHPPQVNLSEELQALLQSLAERLANEAQATVAVERARLERQQAAYQHQRAVETARFEQLQVAYTVEMENHRLLRLREVQLADQLQLLEGERQRLEEGCRQQLHLLEERATTIQSLEAKHQQARESLEHFRQQHQLQRQEELQRHDQQFSQLQAEVRGLREQLAVRQEELTQLYRDLERATSAQGYQQQQLRQLEREMNSAQQNLAAEKRLMNQAHQQAEKMASEITLLREKSRSYLLAHRHDQRLLRVQAQHLTRLQGLTEPGTPDSPMPQ
ncbi:MULTISPECIES: DNA-binding protein [Pseudomonas]|uniref:Transposase n=1 Tax=Pseudomonas putida TaxID=303 RepID=A0A7V8J0U9_PSEPU|nr:MULTISPECIES: DNA-binding protein [Pseudomonas]KAF0250909.1 transposase [Pseudomonas putida]MDS9593410.1 DNA-binding protein [Pseudomonas sp. HTZ1]